MNIKDGVATLVLEYANDDVYEEFIGTEIFVGTVAEAIAEGYTFEGQFAKVSDGTATACENTVTGKKRISKE